MTIDVERAAKPLRKLRKLLKDFPADPPPEQVHSIRTQIRRIEATLHAFPVPGSKRALKLLKPLRRTAGRVRDMDVLIAKATSIKDNLQEEPLVHFIEELSRLRAKHAKTLNARVKKHRDPVRQQLKGCLQAIRNGAAEDQTLGASPAALQILAARLQHWPRLNRENLHDFRKSAKELRYMLQLSPEQEKGRIQALGRVKDSGGEWHDWVEFENLAQVVLDPKGDARGLRAVHQTVRDKFRIALAEATSLRKKGFAMGKKGFAVKVPRRS